MREFRNSDFFRYDHGPGGGSGPGSHGSGYGGGSSGSGFHGNQSRHGNQGNQGNQGGYNHQGSQQQQQQSGYQSNPKQLNSGQYHVFTTSLDKRDQKLHKRAVNSVEPAVPRYLRWSEQRSCGVERIIHPGLIIRVIWHWWWRLRWEVISSPRYSWMGGVVSISFIMKPSIAWG